MVDKAVVVSCTDSVVVSLVWATYRRIQLEDHTDLVRDGCLHGLKPHQTLGYRTPAEVFHGEQEAVVKESNGRRFSPGEGIESRAG